jgi:hypothetical protein
VSDGDMTLEEAAPGAFGTKRYAEAIARINRQIAKSGVTYETLDAFLNKENPRNGFHFFGTYKSALRPISEHVPHRLMTWAGRAHSGAAVALYDPERARVAVGLIKSLAPTAIERLVKETG